MAIKKIKNSEPYVLNRIIINAMPTGVFQKVNGDSVEVKTSRADDLVDKPLNYRNLNVGNTGAVVKDAPGSICSLIVSNVSGGVVYFKVYNKASAPTASDVPVMTFAVANGSTLSIQDALPLTYLDAGISIRVVTEAADNGTTSPTANTVIANILYR